MVFILISYDVALWHEKCSLRFALLTKDQDLGRPDLDSDTVLTIGLKEGFF